MSRIDEIKERFNLYSHKKLHHYGDGDVRTEKEAKWIAEFENPVDADLFINAPSDIEYLLSKLEIAQQALERIIVMENGDGGFHIAEEALQQLRS